MKNFIKSLTYIAVSAALIGCGGASDSQAPITSPGGSVTQPDKTLVEYTVIDGYLSNADVCVIRENSSKCEYLATTNEQGKISIADDITGQLVATVTAGHSKDQDRVGYAANTYQLSAFITEHGANVITPFTTLDVLDNLKDLTDIAAQLNLPLESVAADYIALDSSHNDHAHAIARTLTNYLSETIASNDINQLYAVVGKTNDYITQSLLPNNVDLDTVDIQIAEGEASHIQLIGNLNQFFQGNMDMASLNNSLLSSEGVLDVEFDNGVATINGTYQSNYEIDGSTIKIKNGSETVVDEILYVSENIALTKPNQGQELNLISPIDFGNGNAISGMPYTFSQQDLISRPVYLIFDDSNLNQHQAKPANATLVFEENQVTITSDNEVFSVPYTIEVMNTYYGVYSILRIDMGGHGKDLNYQVVVGDDNLLVLKSQDQLTLMARDKAFADFLQNAWLD